MSKGSGRRRITPSDGLQYDPDSDMTNIEKRGATAHQSGGREISMGLRTGSNPSRRGYHGTHGERRGGVGRNNPERSWKTNGRGKQYDHNVISQEAVIDKRPVSERLAERLRQKSLNGRDQEGRKYRSYNPFPYDPWVWKRPEAAPIITLQGFALFEKRTKEIEQKVIRDREWEEYCNQGY